MDRGSQDGAWATAKWIVRKGKECGWTLISKAFATEGLVRVVQERLIWAETRVGLKEMETRTPKGLEGVLATMWDVLFILKTGLEKFTAVAVNGGWSWDLNTDVWFRINILGGRGRGTPNWCIALETEDKGWARVKGKTWLTS